MATPRGLEYQVSINSDGNAVTLQAIPLAQDSLFTPIRQCEPKTFFAQHYAGTFLALTGWAKPRPTCGIAQRTHVALRPSSTHAPQWLYRPQATHCSIT